MDYYKVLGLGRDANKEEIKDAFRKLALKFHPDRHMKSSKVVQEDAMRRFKEVSEAYDVLGDDKKRAAYSYARTTTGFYNADSSAYRRGGYNNSSTYSGGYNRTYQRRTSWSRAWNFRLGSPLSYFSSMDFLLHAALIGVLMGSIFVADTTIKAIWLRQNRGKSFDESMDDINQKKRERLSRTQEEKLSKET